MSQVNEAQALSAAVARADISPPVGIRSAGFAARGPLTGFHDPLYATALALACGERRATLVSCDLLGLDAETVDQIRAEANRRTGVCPDDMAITCTHTHYGPDPYRDVSAPDVRAYRADLIFKIAGTVQEALSRLQPARLGIAWGQSDIGINRRERTPDGRIVLGNNPTGPVDRALGVVRVDAQDGRPIAGLINFQTHPVCQAGTVSHISADYVGRMRAIVEHLTEARCLFLQGACGNINPILMQPSYEPARTLGTRLGCEVVRLWETITPQPARNLDIRSASIDLPRFRYGSREQAESLVESLQHEVADLEAQNAPNTLASWARLRLDRAQDAVKSWTTGEPLEPLQTTLQAWRIGDVAMAMTTGEIFNEIGVEVKDSSPFKDTFFVGYANDSIGYVPVPEAYPEGGYEVLRACQVDPEAAGVIAHECLRLLASLQKPR